jgi:hypothetical protein
MEGASHNDLYDKEQYVAPTIAKISEFYAANLAELPLPSEAVKGNSILPGMSRGRQLLLLLSNGLHRRAAFVRCRVSRLGGSDG